MRHRWISLVMVSVLLINGHFLFAGELPEVEFGAQRVGLKPNIDLDKGGIVRDEEKLLMVTFHPADPTKFPPFDKITILTVQRGAGQNRESYRFTINEKEKIILIEDTDEMVGWEVGANGGQTPMFAVIKDPLKVNRVIQKGIDWMEGIEKAPAKIIDPINVDVDTAVKLIGKIISWLRKSPLSVEPKDKWLVSLGKEVKSEKELGLGLVEIQKKLRSEYSPRQKGISKDTRIKAIERHGCFQCP